MGMVVIDSLHLKGWKSLPHKCFSPSGDGLWAHQWPLPHLETETKIITRKKSNLADGYLQSYDRNITVSK